MTATNIRPYQGPEDIDGQYDLWLRATDGLAYAWRSNLRNAHAVSRTAERYPGARLYAERGGRLVGYIGTHPPVQWDTGDWLIPFGFPWTYPEDRALECELYDRMLASVPKLYAEPRVSGYVQRFRESWTRHLAFLGQRGWNLRWRLPLLGRKTSPAAAATTPTVAPLKLDQLGAVCELAANDSRAVDVTDEAALRRRLEGGWLELESLWLVPGRGVFEMEVRGTWGEIRLFYACPEADRDDALWSALDAVAQRQGAREVYLTVNERESARHEQFSARGFREVEAGVYLVRPAPQSAVAERPA